MKGGCISDINFENEHTNSYIIFVQNFKTVKYTQTIL